jgi:hypothetical protein
MLAGVKIQTAALSEKRAFIEAAEDKNKLLVYLISRQFAFS